MCRERVSDCVGARVGSPVSTSTTTRMCRERVSDCVGARVGSPVSTSWTNTLERVSDCVGARVGSPVSTSWTNILISIVTRLISPSALHNADVPHALVGRLCKYRRTTAPHCRHAALPPHRGCPTERS
ncbi:hypothetical protein J6590_058785 [Homalodisca vitripennis]|nr:hypothetical protein J6590_058785 [Homalodisca vitripennis]